MEREKDPITNDVLRHERLQRGWSQSDVASKIGSDPKTVSRWERGETLPSLYLRQRLSTLFEKTPEQLGFVKKEHSKVQETPAQASIEDPIQPKTRALRGNKMRFLPLMSIFLLIGLLLLLGVDLWNRTMHTYQGSPCQQHHNLQYCNGQDPVNTGCTSDQQTIQRMKIHDGNGYYYGDIKLERSVQCQTEWAEYTPNQGKTHHLFSLITMRCSLSLSGEACGEKGGRITDQFQIQAGDFGEVRASMAAIAPGSAAASIIIEELDGQHYLLSTFFY